MFVDVILPYSFGGGVFTYSVPDSISCDDITVGARVRVTLRHREMIGVVRSLHENVPSYKVIPILELIDLDPVILPKQIDLMSFAADYYAESLGDVMKAVLPSKIRAEAFDGVKVVAYRFIGESLKDELDRREKHRAQYRALMTYAELSCDTIPLSRLQKSGVTHQTLKKLCEEEILQRVELPRDVYNGAESGCQNQVSELTSRILAEPKTTVVFGLEKVDALVKELVVEGKILLVLMPSSDNDLIDSLWDDSSVRYFASDTVSSRTQAYLRVLKSPGSVRVVFGGRISVFLPFSNLGRIIVLDEHDERYRGQRSPGFNGRDMALMLADRVGVPVTLVSPCPSFEAMKNVRDGVYTLEMVDKEYPVKVLEKGHDLLSAYARQHMADVLQQGKNILVFQNRRGYAGHVECTSCGYIPSCPRCSVQLGFHASERILKCHYCGYAIPYEGKCPRCNEDIASVQGYGTERLASILESLFPEYPVSVLDSDRHEKFNPDARIIVGTSYMIRHDEQLHDIGLVLVCNGDNLLLNTDFRAYEKAYRTMMTLRMTAKESGAEFIVQTNDFRQPVFKCLEDSSFTSFIDEQLQERYEMDFPPYTRMMRLEFRYTNNVLLRNAVDAFYGILTANVPDCTISPVFEPDIERVDMEYILQIVIRFQRNRDGLGQKRTVIAIVAKAVTDILKKIRVYIEVDPQ